MTLLVKSKTCGKAVWHMTSEVREAEYILLLKLIHIALEINRRDLTNRVGRGHVCLEHVRRGRTRGPR